MTYLTKREAELIEEFRQLDPEGQKAALQAIWAFVAKASPDPAPDALPPDLVAT